jgi:hypothetical protein
MPEPLAPDDPGAAAIPPKESLGIRIDQETLRPLL